MLLLGPTGAKLLFSLCPYRERICRSEVPGFRMKLLSKVVWSEGMYLAPHHFQAQNRYFEDSVQFATASLWRHAFGLVSCELDADAIRNGTVALVHAVGVFPDGLPFDMPECDPLPPVRNI